MRLSVSARDVTLLKLFEPCFLLLKTGVESREVDEEVTCRVKVTGCENGQLFISVQSRTPEWSFVMVLYICCLTCVACMVYLLYCVGNYFYRLCNWCCTVLYMCIR